MGGKGIEKGRIKANISIDPVFLIASSYELKLLLLFPPTDRSLKDSISMFSINIFPVFSVYYSTVGL